MLFHDDVGDGFLGVSGRCSSVATAPEVELAVDVVRLRELGAKRVDVGDGGWWVQRDGGPLELRATKGRASIHASIPDGPARADALVAAGVALAAKLE